MSTILKYFKWGGECPCHRAGNYELLPNSLVAHCDEENATLICERMAHYTDTLEWPVLLTLAPEQDTWGQKEYHRRHYGKSEWGVNEHPAEPENITYPGDSR